MYRLQCPFETLVQPRNEVKICSKALSLFSTPQPSSVVFCAALLSNMFLLLQNYASLSGSLLIAWDPRGADGADGSDGGDGKQPSDAVSTADWSDAKRCGQIHA